MGLFITFEGIEGCGKTTQFNLLGEYLGKKGVSVLSVREPGGTPLGEKVRKVLLNSGGHGIDPWAELFLYEACRAELVTTVIRPALGEGRTVLCDRFTDSTVAYQGYGRGISVASIEEINRYATGGIVPDLTFLIDCPPEVGLGRAWDRINSSGAVSREDRFEKEDIAFHRKVREGYLELAGREPARIKVVDGRRPVEEVHSEIRGIVEGFAPARG